MDPAGIVGFMSKGFKSFGGGADGSDFAPTKALIAGLVAANVAGLTVNGQAARASDLTQGPVMGMVVLSLGTDRGVASQRYQSGNLDACFTIGQAFANIDVNGAATITCVTPDGEVHGISCDLDGVNDQECEATVHPELRSGRPEQYR